MKCTNTSYASFFFILTKSDRAVVHFRTSALYSNEKKKIITKHNAREGGEGRRQYCIIVVNSRLGFSGKSPRECEMRKEKKKPPGRSNRFSSPPIPHSPTEQPTKNRFIENSGTHNEIFGPFFFCFFFFHIIRSGSDYYSFFFFSYYSRALQLAIIFDP